MERIKKEEIVRSLHNVFEQTQFVIVSCYKSGFKACHFKALHETIRKSGGHCIAIKKKLASIAAKNTDYDNGRISNMLGGSVAIIHSTQNDLSSVSKALVNFCKDNDKLEVLGAATKNEVLTAVEVKAIASLPTKEELRAQFCGILSSPIANLLSVLEASQKDITGLLLAYVEKQN